MRVETGRDSDVIKANKTTGDSHYNRIVAEYMEHKKNFVKNIGFDSTRLREEVLVSS